MVVVSTTPTRPDLTTALHDFVTAIARDGGPLPSETSLVARFGASRPAVREALARLEERGLIHRSQGASTAINPSLPRLKARLDEEVDKSEIISALGLVSTLHVHRKEIVEVTDAEVEHFGLRGGCRALRTTKVWSADGVPCTMAVDSIPLEVDQRALAAAEIDATPPVWHLAEAINGVHAAWETVWLTADKLDEIEAWLLQRTAGEAVLRLTLHGLDPHGRTAYWADEIQTRDPIDYSLVRNIRRVRPTD